ncbi:MAG: quinol:cytochrome c oxidoreductase iron-sulfur protein precursor [Bryobacterales bacterium]|nr:quinol:cytochrome c oxidoreductase iron-sulfur protein precursor [Bryobacterales bacterium]
MEKTSLVQITNQNPTPLPSSDSNGAANGPQYWRSLDQLADTPEFRQWVEREFPEDAAAVLDGNSRRSMLKIMAASFGLAGLAACRRPELRMAPQARGREDYVPGSPYNYTSAFVLGGHASGVVVQTYEGRPTKIEGNPDHPASLGAALTLAQASVLGVYDPDRSKVVLEGGKESSWEKFEAAVKGLSLGDGSGLRFLSETVLSPTLESMRADALKKWPKAKWVEYESIARDNERAGAMLAFGQAVNVHPQFDKAKVILSLDYDFLGLDWPTPLATKLFSRNRHVNSDEDLEKISRLYVVESQFSLTGANAEHRLRMRGGDVQQFAADLVAALNAPPAGNDKRAKFIAALAKDLKAAGKEALVVAGPRQPAVVHALAHQINQTLGAAGSTVTFTKVATADRVESGVDALKALTGEINGGQVSTLIILGGNPAYTAPADLQFSAALAKVANSIHLGAEDDETAMASKWHLPEAHYLEAWGDARATDGVVAVQQPMIEPIFGGKSAIEVMALLLDSKDRKGHDLVKNFWTVQWPATSKENTWRKALNDGVIAGSAAVEVKPTVGKIQAPAPAAPGGGIEVGFVPSATAWDGRFANNAWMQEAPDPITKLVWGHAALISPAMARERKLKDGDMISLSRGNVKLEAAVMIQPGHADNAVTISLGYGRPRCGSVGKEVGFNASLIRTSNAFWFAPDFTLTATGDFHQHASVQEHGSMVEPTLMGQPHTRPVYRETTIEEYRKERKVIEDMQEVPELHSIYPERKWEGLQWGMAIDLGACTGCNACVVACQAENNVPVVGKAQVLKGREMHWLRMDRYYVGSEDDPRAVEQPIPCMQCENAPCENVCPVQATTHSPEGLNDMAYNRCVGTRYCSNNCPFKVRHFNFLDWHKNFLERRRIEPELMSMVYNPDVTVRMRGIMEKCTYCVQRIQEARITAKTDGRKQLNAEQVVTACQQTCPADAIAFGNINDPNSKVAKLKAQERNYALLAELDVKPRTTYLGRLRNPNPELEAS